MWWLQLCCFASKSCEETHKKHLFMLEEFLSFWFQKKLPGKKYNYERRNLWQGRNLGINWTNLFLQFSWPGATGGGCAFQALLCPLAELCPVASRCPTHFSGTLPTYFKIIWTWTCRIAQMLNLSTGLFFSPFLTHLLPFSTHLAVLLLSRLVFVQCLIWTYTKLSSRWWCRRAGGRLCLQLFHFFTQDPAPSLRCQTLLNLLQLYSSSSEVVAGSLHIVWSNWWSERSVQVLGN